MPATSNKTIDRDRVNLRSPAVRTLGVLALAAAWLVPLGAAAQALARRAVRAIIAALARPCNRRCLRACEAFDFR